MKKALLLGIAVFITAITFGQVIINEIHYDNAGADADEGFEIAGTAGLNLSGYTVVLYNGNGGGSYGSTINLSGMFTNQTNGFGFIWFPVSSGIQNGSPDGIALVNPSGMVIQFLSYDGVITATDGPANGLTSTDIGVSQNGGSTVGDSLQYDGTNWIGPVADTRGTATVGQTTLSIVKNEIDGFALYPNPVENGNIFLNSNSSVSKQINIYDLNGLLLYKSNVKNKEPINISHLPKGVFISKILENNKIATRKIIVN